MRQIVGDNHDADMLNQLPDWYLSHFIQKNYNIIGFDLKPYSIWHYIHLTAINSPILSGIDPDTSIQDLETACFICTTKYGDNVGKLLEEYNLNEDTKAYREQLFIHLQNNPSYLAKEAIKFKEYQKSFEKPPTNSDFGEDETSIGTPNEVPWPLVAVSSVMKTYHYSEEEAMNLPIGKLITLVYVARYLETGESPILSDAKMMCLQLARGDLKFEDVVKN